MLVIRLPAEDERRLGALARATGRTQSFHARQAILEYLDDFEDLYLAEQRVASMRANKVQPIPFAECVRLLGHDGDAG